MLSEKTIETDILVIGGGVAGLFAAIKAKEAGASVTLVDKGYIGRSGASNFASGFYSVFNPQWGHDLNAWMTQINVACEYLNNPTWTEITLKESYERYQDLISWGVKFIPKENGEPYVERRGVLEAIPMYRWQYTPILRKQAIKSKANIIDRIMVTDLLMQDGMVIGAAGFHVTSGDFYVFKAKATIITAGSGSFKLPGMPIHCLTSDGEAMAYRAGAEISNKEFWHISAYYQERAGKNVPVEEKDILPVNCSPGWLSFGSPLVHFHNFIDAEGYEVVSQIGAVHDGHAPILWNLDAASDEEKRLMLQYLESGRTLFRFERAGIDINRGGKLRQDGNSGFVGMGVHGGVAGITAIDTNCATGLPGLYAAGDACDTRAVGATYPAGGFALRNASVTGARAGRSAAEYAAKTGKTNCDSEILAGMKGVLYAPAERKGGFSPWWVIRQLQSTMAPYYIWHFRHGERLKSALTLVEYFKNNLIPKLTAKDTHELRLANETKNMVLNAEMMLRTALFRAESRGSHYREDYPRRDDANWLAWVKLKKDGDTMKLVKELVPEEWRPDMQKPYAERYPKRFLGESV